MKKLFIAMLTGMMIFTVAAAASMLLPEPSAHNVYVDGQPVKLSVYEIADNNYFKLRDLAALVNQTDKQFSVSWNEQKQYIHINTNRPYTLVGGELNGSTVTQQAKPSTHNIYIDGRPFHFTAYEIAGNNYFKLRDLAAALDIGIGWDEAAQRVDILTTQGYDKPSREEMLPIDYIGMTMDELGDLWGFPFTYMDYWYSGNAKGVYYDDMRVPMAFYYYDADFAGHAQGPEEIIVVSLGQNAYPQIREIAPGLPVNATYPGLLDKGYQTELYMNSDEMSGENDATAYCCIELSGVRVFFYWYDYADPYTAPADLIELSTSI